MSTLLIIYIVGLVLAWAGIEAYLAYEDDFGSGLGFLPALVWPILLGVLVITSPAWVGMYIGKYLKKRKEGTIRYRDSEPQC